MAERTKAKQDYIPGVNKHLQGTIWKWEKSGGKGSHPVLVISNDAFNKASQEVNCVAISKTSSKTGRTSEPILLGKPSHIQCGKLHTISKDELVEFEGTIEPATLANVFAKIRMQLGMGDDRNFELLGNINKTVDVISERQLEAAGHNYTLDALLEGIEEIKVVIGKIGVANAEPLPKPSKAVAAPAPNADAPPENKNPKRKKPGPKPKEKPPQPAKTKQIHRKYTDEDVDFILNKETTIDALIERFDYKSRAAATSARNYFRKKAAIKSEQTTSQ